MIKLDNPIRLYESTDVDIRFDAYVKLETEPKLIFRKIQNKYINYLIIRNLEQITDSSKNIILNNIDVDNLPSMIKFYLGIKSQFSNTPHECIYLNNNSYKLSSYYNRYKDDIHFILGKNYADDCLLVKSKKLLKLDITKYEFTDSDILILSHLYKLYKTDSNGKLRKYKP